MYRRFSFLALFALSAFLARRRAVPGQSPKSMPPTIAGRPVQLDSEGKLLPWPMPDNTGYSYSSHFLTQWSILWDQYNRQRYHYFFCCFDFDRTTFEMQPDWHWANSTAYLRAMMQGFMERLYPYTGDPNTITFLQDFIDYELENGLTPENYAWARVPYTSANPGDRRYTGWSHHGEDYLEPHVVGEDGYAYLRFYEMTGNTKYLAGRHPLRRRAGEELQDRRRAELALAGALLRPRRQGRRPRHGPVLRECRRAHHALRRIDPARSGRCRRLPAGPPGGLGVAAQVSDEEQRLGRILRRCHAPAWRT